MMSQSVVFDSVRGTMRFKRNVLNHTSTPSTPGAVVNC